MSTIREEITRQSRKFKLGGFACWLGMVAALSIGSYLKIRFTPGLFIVPFVIFLFIALRIQLGGVRCPVCQANLFAVIGGGSSSGLKVRSEYKFCPGCGTGLDQELQTAVAAQPESRIAEITDARKRCS